MEFWLEIKSWIPLCSFVLTVVLLIYNYLSHQKIVNNDLTHLAIDVKEVIKKIDNLDNKLEAHEKEIGILFERTKDL